MNKKTKLNIVDITVGAMLILVVGIMPLVVRLAERPLPPELLRYPLQLFVAETYNDMFTYWKGLLVLMPAVVITFVYASDWITRGKMPDYKTFFKKPHVIFSMVYLVFVIISAALSQYPYTSWFGTYDRNEGAFMWFAYFVIFFAAMHFVREPICAKFILFSVAFSSIIMGAIGVSQLIGHDFFNTDFARWLVTLGTHRAEDRHLLNPEFQIAYGTLFNPNTFGKYTAMLSPVLLLAALTYRGKKYINIIFLVAGGLMLIGVFASSSLGGLVGVSTAAGVLAITFLCRFGVFGKKFALAAGAVVFVLVLAILFMPPLNYRVTFLFNRLGTAMRAETHSIQNYVFEENTMSVYGEYGKILSITVHGLTEDWLTVRDTNGNEIPPSSRVAPPLVRGASLDEVPPTVYTFDILGYRTITIYKLPHFFLYFHATPTPFWLTLKDGRIYSISPAFALVDLHRDIPAWGFYGRETWGSNRGYIWSRSFPLMPSRTLIGSGSDTFVNVFPQFDIVSMQRFFTPPLHPYAIVDKAHNLFIQTWLSTGGISAIALFALFGHYLLTTFVSLMKTKPTESGKGEPIFTYGLRLGLLAGISAYCMSSMATDSTIGSTGVFFVLLGVGYGINSWRVYV